MAEEHSREYAEESELLRERILAALRKQGFDIEGTKLRFDSQTKDAVRALHREAKKAKIERTRTGLVRHEARLVSYFAQGDAVTPKQIRPRLQEVQPETEDELLFRYTCLHWSIPVSSGYGRRLRFLVFDEQNGKLIGLLGLGDPIFALGSRDSWIGWDKEIRRSRLRNVMDAFVLGAVPPYSYLLCGKLVAMLAASAEVQETFRRKYGGKTSFISGCEFDGQLALITTASALGRSSLYNRIRFRERPMYIRTGTTSGSGEFHFSNGVYSDLLEFAHKYCIPTAKHKRWGSGWRSRRETVRVVLSQLGLPRQLLYHGVQREVYVVPTAENTQEFLRGIEDQLRPYPAATADMFAWFRERWLLPRAARDARYRDFAPDSLFLWRDE